MFVDEVNIIVKGGDGGHGALSFHREKFLPKGGPDGGDGGKGGDVYIVGDENIDSLRLYISKRNLEAESGTFGQGNNKSGKNGKNLYVGVPLGTCIYSENRFLGEVLSKSDRILVAKGGRGGRGNSNFLSNRYRAPEVAEKGEPGEEVRLHLILKSLVDVAIVGFPNRGKSLLLSLLTNAHPKIADYPFTTTEPNFGVLDTGINLIRFVDLPAIIKGSYSGLGLGNKFLRHGERARIIVILFETREEIEIIKEELSLYNRDFLEKHMILVPREDLSSEEKLSSLREEIIRLFNAARGRISSTEDSEYIVEMEPVVIEKRNGRFYIKNKSLSKDIGRIDFNQRDYHLLLDPLFRRYGILDALKRYGATEGSKVFINDIPFVVSEGRIRCEL
ncbi:MAG: GTPase ObgE [bacterium]